MMRLKILILCLFGIFVVNGFADTNFEFNFGGGASFPVSPFSSFYNEALEINAKLKQNLPSNSSSPTEKEDIVQSFADLANIAKSGVKYGIYSQFGAKFDDFISVGGELLFDMNLVKVIKRSDGTANENFSFIMGITPRFYTKLDFFVLALAFFTGPKINIATSAADSVLAELGTMGWDIGARLSFSFLILEGYYVWNIKNSKFSDFKFGIGFEFGIV
ncbi:hypothetical protein SAMN02983004_00312 [Borreliella japonica]|uniref:Uncharacterized protein n=1 Tax=Borreliella japonica TaxID=34095 RepID=A0A1G4P7F2_BORJA|nr:hypothetical protein [Borreliella japonica]WKC89135.1 hypothetical protein QIA20_03320 [Borreliella japonica]SCW28121.1 hypothetical protein SAMN02983004_00312 [Borreliella japonica]